MLFPPISAFSYAVLRLRGLPWDATKENVQRFLSPIAQVDAEDIMLVRNLRGDAYAIMREADAMQKAGTLHRQKVRRFLHGVVVRWLASGSRGALCLFVCWSDALYCAD